MDFSDAAEIEPAEPATLSLLSSGEHLSLDIPVVGSEMVAYHRDPSVPDTPLTPLTPPLYSSHEEGRGTPPLALLPPTAQEGDTPMTGNEVVPRGDTFVARTNRSPDEGGGFVFAAPAPPPASLPAPPQYPSLLAGTEVGRPGMSPSDVSGGSSGPVMKASLRRRRGGSSHLPLPPSHSMATKVINESMVSLLLKLYPKFAGGASYRPEFDKIPKSRMGDGGYFISLVLNKMGHHDSASRAHIINAVRCTKPPAESSSSADDGGEPGTSSDTSSEECRRKAKEERARLSAIRKEKVMEAFKKKQTKFCEEHKDILSSIDTEITEPPSPVAVPPQLADLSEESPASEDEGVDLEDMPRPLRGSDWEERIKCSHCSMDRDVPLGMSIFILPNSAQCQRRLAMCKGNNFPLTEKRLKALKPENKNSLHGCAKERFQAGHSSGYHMSWQLFENRGFDFSCMAVTCGHFVHLDCHANYQRNIRPGTMQQMFSLEAPILEPRRGDFLCTTCRGFCNATLPLTPYINHWIHHGNVPQRKRAMRYSNR